MGINPPSGSPSGQDPVPGQLQLTGFNVAARPTDRLFFAIVPDIDAATRLAELAQQLRGQHGLRGRPLAKDHFHITLHHLGDHPGLPEDLIAVARTAAATVVMPSFQVEFDHVLSFQRRSNKPLVLRGGEGLATLTTFQQMLGMAMKKAGLGRWVDARFTPHVTLLYDDCGVAEQAVEAIAWTAKEFVLVHSLLGRTRHITLGRWPLRG